MAAMTVLAVGVDVSSHATKRWEHRGLFLKFVHTPGEAVPLLRDGDFDLCVLGNSISIESRAKLMSYLRETLHSKLPVLSLKDEFRSSEYVGAVVPRHGTGDLLESVQEFLLDAKQNAEMAAQWRELGQRAFKRVS